MTDAKQNVDYGVGDGEKVNNGDIDGKGRRGPQKSDPDYQAPSEESQDEEDEEDEIVEEDGAEEHEKPRSIQGRVNSSLKNRQN